MDAQENNEKVLKKFNEIQQEIIKIGWTGVLNKYHPDINLGADNAFELFKLYKEIYLLMKKRLTIT